jgi:hypothetical protein
VRAWVECICLNLSIKRRGISCRPERLLASYSFCCKQLAIYLPFYVHLLYMWDCALDWLIVSHELPVSLRCPNNVFGRQTNCHCHSDDSVSSDGALWSLVPYVSRRQHTAAPDSSILHTCLTGGDKCLDSYNHKGRYVFIDRMYLVGGITPTFKNVERFEKVYNSGLIRL